MFRKKGLFGTRKAGGLVTNMPFDRADTKRLVLDLIRHGSPLLQGVTQALNLRPACRVELAKELTISSADANLLGVLLRDHNMRTSRRRGWSRTATKAQEMATRINLSTHRRLGLDADG